MSCSGKPFMFCRYDREFLLQFELFCKEKPESFPPLDAIGLEPVDQLQLTRGGSGRSRQPSGTTAPSRQASIGAGVPGTNLRSQYQSMGQFTTSSGKFGPGSERFETGGGRSVSLSGASVPFRNPPLQGGLVTVSQNVGVYVTLVACYFIDDWNRCVRMLSLQ